MAKKMEWGNFYLEEDRSLCYCKFVKFVFVDSRHNIFHWLVVISIRMIFFLILTPLSLYLTIAGFLLSEETIRNFLPPSYLEKINFYLVQVPHFQVVKKAVFSLVGHWYKEAPVWWAMVVGIPLILIGISVFFINFFELYYSIVSLSYQQTHCPFCEPPPAKAGGFCLKSEAKPRTESSF